MDNSPKMKLRNLFSLFSIAILFAACIPVKDLTYLQKKEGSIDSPINPVPAKPYRLQTSDVITISIKSIDPKLVALFNPSSNNEKANQTEIGLYFEGYSVDDHGNIRVPQLGEINVLGFTVDEVRQKIEDALLKDYFKKEANIFVTVKLAGMRFTVNGEVAMPGTKMLYQDKVTVLEALANSGDITMTGDRKNVTIIRQFPQGTEMHSIDLTDVSAMQSPYYYLQPNDYIYVKPLKQKSWGTGKTGIESITTLIAVLTLATTTFLILKN